MSSEDEQAEYCEKCGAEIKTGPIYEKTNEVIAGTEVCRLVKFIEYDPEELTEDDCELLDPDVELYSERFYRTFHYSEDRHASLKLKGLLKSFFMLHHPVCQMVKHMSETVENMQQGQTDPADSKKEPCACGSNMDSEPVGSGVPIVGHTEQCCKEKAAEHAAECKGETQECADKAAETEAPEKTDDEAAAA